jgi:putative transposase
LWPRKDGDLGRFMQRLTTTNVRRWHTHRHSEGRGHLCQGVYKSFPVQDDRHFLTVARYVERNALRASLVERAENWRWSGLWRRERGSPQERGSTERVARAAAVGLANVGERAANGQGTGGVTGIRPSWPSFRRPRLAGRNRREVEVTGTFRPPGRPKKLETEKGRKTAK